MSHVAAVRYIISPLIKYRSNKEENYHVWNVMAVPFDGNHARLISSAYYSVNTLKYYVPMRVWSSA